MRGSNELGLQVGATRWGRVSVGTRSYRHTPYRIDAVTQRDLSLTLRDHRALTGLDMLRAMRDGTLPGPPIAGPMRMALKEVEFGKSVFTCDPDETLYNPFGVVHGGAICTVLDSATGCAAGSVLEAGLSYTSIDIDVSFLRPITVSMGTLFAVGTVTKPGKRVIFTEGRLTDSGGTLLATATSRLLVFPTPLS